MTSGIKNVCVFSSSSGGLAEKYYKDAEELGFLMAKSGFNLVYGGGAIGTMYANAKAVKAFGGKVIGVIPEKLHKVCAQNCDCDELIITDGMRTRKEKLDKLSDAVIALSGGFGTLEELSEMIVQKQLGYNNKAIVILNTEGFYNHLVDFFEVIINKNFAIEESRELYYVASTPQEAVNYLINYMPKELDLTRKFVVS